MTELATLRYRSLSTRKPRHWKKKWHLSKKYPLLKKEKPRMTWALGGRRLDLVKSLLAVIWNEVAMGAKGDMEGQVAKVVLAAVVEVCMAAKEVMAVVAKVTAVEVPWERVAP